MKYNFNINHDILEHFFKQLTWVIIRNLFNLIYYNFHGDNSWVKVDFTSDLLL